MKNTNEYVLVFTKELFASPIWCYLVSDGLIISWWCWHQIKTISKAGQDPEPIFKGFSPFSSVSRHFLLQGILSFLLFSRHKRKVTRYHIISMNFHHHFICRDIPRIHANMMPQCNFLSFITDFID